MYRFIYISIYSFIYMPVKEKHDLNKRIMKPFNMILPSIFRLAPFFCLFWFCFQRQKSQSFRLDMCLDYCKYQLGMRTLGRMIVKLIIFIFFFKVLSTSFHILAESGEILNHRNLRMWLSLKFPCDCFTPLKSPKLMNTLLQHLN